MSLRFGSNSKMTHWKVQKIIITCKNIAEIKSIIYIISLYMPNRFFCLQCTYMICNVINYADSRGKNSAPQPPQQLVEQFSFEQLHSIMANNNGSALGLYDEMSTMYEELDIYKHAGSRQDRSTLLKLYNGGSWSRTFRNVSA